MKFRCLCFTLLTAPLWAQQQQQPQIVQQTMDLSGVAVKPDTVVAKVNGKPMTASDVDKLIAALPQTQRMVAQREPGRFLVEWALFQTILEYAEKAKLEEQSPYKERLAELRRQVLVNAQVNEVTMNTVVTPEQQKKYYTDNPEKFREAKGKLIYISFNSQDPKAKKRTEKEAEELAKSVAAKARSGAEFAKLVKEYSEDPGSVARGGDIGMTLRWNTPDIPEPIRKAMLGMKTGQISEPVKVENGFYVFEADSVKDLAYDSVKDDIFKELKDQGLKKWIEDARKQTTVTVENAVYFNRQPAPAK